MGLCQPYLLACHSSRLTTAPASLRELSTPSPVSPPLASRHSRARKVRVRALQPFPRRVQFRTPSTGAHQKGTCLPIDRNRDSSLECYDPPGLSHAQIVILEESSMRNRITDSGQVQDGLRSSIGIRITTTPEPSTYYAQVSILICISNSWFFDTT